MEEGENTDNQNSWYKNIQIIFTLCLIALFIITLFPASEIILDNNKLILLAFIMVLILSHSFSEIQIPGFLKLSKAVESVQKETQELRSALIQVASSQSTSEAKSIINFGALGESAKELGEKILESREEEGLKESIIEETPKSDVEKIMEYFEHGDYTAAFSVLRYLLEGELIKLLRKNGIQVPFGLRLLNEAALRGELIIFDVYNGVDIVRRTANQFVHPVEDDYLPIEKMKYIVNLGITVYQRLKRLNQD